jgi:RNA polymerase sigma-70 factor (sigma-E family)
MARDDDDFAAFAGASFHRLRRAGYLMTGNEQQGEDAAQTALVRTYAKWSKVRKQDPYAYARRVLTNYVTDQWRRPIRETARDDVPDLPVSRDLADDVSQQQWLIEALGTLAVRERTVLVMRHYFDMPERDVAEELGIALGTVKSLTARALAKLRVWATLNYEPSDLPSGALR